MTTPPLYKDYSKEASDLLSKNFTDAGLLLIENKYKGADQTVFINPQLEKAGPKLDVQYNDKSKGMKYKLGVTLRGFPEITVGHELGPHSSELSTGKQQFTYDYKYGVLAYHVRLSTKDVTKTMSWECCKHAAIGGGVVYDYTAQAFSWFSLGFYYSCCPEFRVSVQASRTKGTFHYHTAGYYAFNNELLKCVKLGLVAHCGQKDGAKVSAGTEFGCPFGSGATLRLKMDNTFVASLAAIRKFAGGWTASVAIDSKNKKPGFLFTHE